MKPAWHLGDRPASYDLASRAAIRQRSRLVVAKDNVPVLWDGRFYRLRRGISRLVPEHPIVQGNPDLWAAGPLRRAGTREGGPVAVSQSTASAGRTLTGHFAVFDEWTEIRNIFEGHFLERIAPGAFARSFREAIPKVQLQHGRDPMVGEKPIASVEDVREDATGASYRATLLDGVPELLVSGLAAGVYGASFRFRVLREELVARPEESEHNPQRLPERTLLEVSVSEFGPVTFGAYPTATAALAA